MTRFERCSKPKRVHARSRSQLYCERSRTMPPASSGGSGLESRPRLSAGMSPVIRTLKSFASSGAGLIGIFSANLHRSARRSMNNGPSGAFADNTQDFHQEPPMAIIPDKFQDLLTDKK